MNILIIDNSIALTGAIRCAFNEAEILRDRHKFTFVLPSRTTLAGNIEKQGYTVHYLPMVEVAKNLPALLKYIPSLLANAIRLHRIVRKEKIDVVQVNDFYNLLGAALKWSGFKGKLITYIRFLPSVMPAALKNTWISLAHKYSNAVIGVSMAVINELPPNKLNTLIYDPVKFNETLPVKQVKPHDEVNILYVANYIRGKGQEYAVKAFADAYKQNKNIRLCFTGGDMGLQKNKAFKKELQQIAESLGIKSVVTFDGFSPSTEKEIKNADIALNFSMAESFSMTCLEAAYYGTSLYSYPVRRS